MSQASLAFSMEEVTAMEASETLVHGSLSLTVQAGHGWRGVMAALGARLMKAWVGLYAPPPRRLGPLL